MNPFYLMAVLYFILAALGALDVALVNFDLLPTLAGYRWLRIHFITVGALTQVLFGALPHIVAARHKLTHTHFRLDIWALLNVGIVSLVVGIPTVNSAAITIGGTLVFIAVMLLMQQIAQLTPKDAKANTGKPMSGKWFYLTGLLYLLLGVLIGTGLWQPWMRWFYMKVPIEVHIHANNWGFMSLAFAGLLVDLLPRRTGEPIAAPGTIKWIFWMMTFGALGLVLGPWTQSKLFTVPGLVLHVVATVWLLVSVVNSVRRTTKVWTIGLLHITTSYVWILAPIMVAPLILLEVPGFPGAGIEQNAPQALIYGWVLQFSYALVPLIIRSMLSDDDVEFGGSWLSLITVHLGGILLWVGIFFTDSRAVLHGTAYALWFISMLPIALDLWRTIQHKINPESVRPTVPAVGD